MAGKAGARASAKECGNDAHTHTSTLESLLSNLSVNRMLEPPKKRARTEWNTILTEAGVPDAHMNDCLGKVQDLCSNSGDHDLQLDLLLAILDHMIDKQGQKAKAAAKAIRDMIGGQAMRNHPNNDPN
eukprot:701788-Amphidinium_carterae.1